MVGVRSLPVPVTEIWDRQVRCLRRGMSTDPYGGSGG
jgi:hypothetical protein